MKQISLWNEQGDKKVQDHLFRTPQRARLEPLPFRPSLQVPFRCKSHFSKLTSSFIFHKWSPVDYVLRKDYISSRITQILWRRFSHSYVRHSNFWLSGEKKLFRWHKICLVSDCAFWLQQQMRLFKKFQCLVFLKCTFLNAGSHYMN